LSHLINITPMPRMDVALGDEVPGEPRDRIWRRSDMYRARSRGDTWGRQPICVIGTTCSKNGAGGIFSTAIVNEMMGKGCGRVLGPADIVVSALDTDVEEGEVVMDRLT
jgi:hypothetical protein